MNTRQLLITGWDWDPSIVIGCGCLTVIYLVLARPRTGKNTAYFLSGVLVMFLALVSPIDTLSDTYLFSAHMLQHLLLMLATPPLLILGIPGRLVNRVLAWPPARTTEQVLSRPVLAWVLAMGTMALWHLPVLYDAALANEWIHIVQHLCFLVMATIFWWPLLSPVKSLRLETPAAVAYLFSAIIANTVLAASITFAPLGLYPAYLTPNDDLGLLPLIREQWGISPRLDQQLGGLLMWVPGCSVYLWAILAFIFHWLGQPQPTDQPDNPAADISSAAAIDRRSKFV